MKYFIILLFVVGSLFAASIHKEKKMEFGQEFQLQLGSKVVVGPLVIKLAKIDVPERPAGGSAPPGGRPIYFLLIQQAGKEQQVRVDPQNAFTPFGDFFLTRIAGKFNDVSIALKVLPKLNIKESLGRQISLEGKVANARFGPILRTKEGPPIWIDGLKQWPQDLYIGGYEGENVKITGTLVERNDLPVFDSKVDPPLAGTSVPPGIDLKKVTKRYVLTNAKWERLEK